MAFDEIKLRQFPNAWRSLCFILFYCKGEEDSLQLILGKFKFNEFLIIPIILLPWNRPRQLLTTAISSNLQSESPPLETLISFSPLSQNLLNILQTLLLEGERDPVKFREGQTPTPPKQHPYNFLTDIVQMAEVQSCNHHIQLELSGLSDTNRVLETSCSLCLSKKSGQLLYSPINSFQPSNFETYGFIMTCIIYGLLASNARKTDSTSTIKDRKQLNNPWLSEAYMIQFD